MVVAETIESKRRSRSVRLAATIGIVAAGLLVAYGFSQANDDRSPDSDTPPTIAVIQLPAVVQTTQAVGGQPSVSPSATDDVPVVPTGTADIAFPPVSSDIPGP